MAVQHNHSEMRIARIWDECEGIKTFELDGEVDSRAGRFIMLFDHESTENPLTVSYDKPLRVMVKARGEDDGDNSFTNRLFRKKVGDRLQVTGPTGNCFADVIDMERPLYVVMGGCGCAGLPLLEKEAEAMRKPLWYIFGFGGRSQIPGVVRETPQHYQSIATMDGSAGISGDVLKAIEAVDFAKDAQAIVCGPRKMLIAAGDRLSERLGADNVIVSLEAYMKCGRGICASCAVNGYHACTDGPNFRYSLLKDAPDFRYCKRGKSGAPEPL